MNFKNDQFYLDMQSIKNNSLTVQNYISNKFGNFWKSFYSYLTYFHKQINQRSVFPISRPRGYLAVCFESISKVLEKASIENYNESMKPFMTNCFKSMLHPDNIDFIKQAALDFFIIIYPRLKKSNINYTEDFEQYFFDFSFVDNNLKITSIDNEIRIQLTDQEPPKSFNSKIENFLNTINQSIFVLNSDNDDIRSWWSFIQKHIIVIIFYSILKKKPQIQGISSISDFPQETERIVINFLINIIQDPFIKVILPIENSSDNIVDILLYLSQESMITKINSLEFIKKFIKVLIDKKVNIIEILYDKNYHLLLEMMNVMLNCLNFAFSGDNELIEELTIIITTYFDYIFKLFNDDYKYELCSYISNYEKITNASCLLHFLTLLLSLFVNNQVTDKKLWNTIINSEGLFDMNVFLSCYAYFAGYYSTYSFQILLGLKSDQLSYSFTSTSKLSNFFDLSNLMWSKEFGDAFIMEFQNMFLNLRQQLIHSLVLATPGITSIKMEKLFPNDKGLLPEKDEILKLLRVMFYAFVWQDKKYENDKLNQFYCYLVCASFITPLLKISNVISPDITFDRNFLIDEFLTYLKNCIKSSGQNLLIKLHALTSLGNIICWKNSLSALDELSLADWYLTLHDLIITGGDNNNDDDHKKDDLKTKIKISALTFACRSITLGFKGSSILLKTIADNFDILGQISSEIATSGSSLGLSSFLVEEGFEILTPSDVASLIISLSNVCEISNMLSFDCYKSEESDNEDDDSGRKNKDELKLKLIQNCLESADPSLRATTILSLISEEAEANRCNETNMKKLLEILFQYFKDLTPEKVYAATTLTLILPELEKVRKGSVALILDEAINAIENKEITDKDKDELLFGRFTEFVVDLLIYSSSIINTEEQLRHFMNVTNTWDISNFHEDDQKHLKKFTDQTKQRLQYAVMSLTAHYLRFPPPTPSFSETNFSDNLKSFSAESDSKLPAASFGTSNDCIIRVCDNEVASLLPVGKFTWNYKSIAPAPEKRIVSDDVQISESISNVSDHPMQIAFTNRFVSFVDDLYENHFTDITENNNENNNNDNKNSNNNGNNDEGENNQDHHNDIFEVRYRHIYQPSDFESAFAPSLDTPSFEDIKLAEERLPPHSVGPRAAAFMSSLNFFDSQLTNRFFPAFQAYKNVEVSEFRHVIHVGFISHKSTENDSHFIDFKCGLGLLDDTKTSIICADSRHQLVFHIDQDEIKENKEEIERAENGNDQPKKKKTLKDKNAQPEIFICWNDKRPTEQWVNTFDLPNQKIRLEISPTHSGLFNVSVLVNKNYNQSDFCSLSNVLVSKNNLPNYIISQIIVNVHVLDFKNNTITKMQLQNGTDIRDKREKEFTPYCLLMNCEKTLLTKANSNKFDENNTNE